VHNQDAAPSALRAPQAEELFDIYAIGLTTRKRHGEAAEAAFLAKASSAPKTMGADAPCKKRVWMLARVGQNGPLAPGISLV